MRNISSLSCIQFKEAGEKDTAYVNITTDDSSCYSAVGFTNSVQRLNLKLDEVNKNCFQIGTIMHELFHTLGFQHQHSSPDRDVYVEIIKDNIKDGEYYNFKKFNESDVTDFGVGYDYESIMHYRDTAFSKNGNKTIIPKKDVEIGQRRKLSDKDIEKLKLMYKCDE